MMLRTTPFFKKLFLSGLLFVLLVPLFYVVTKVGIKYYRQEQCANYLFYSLTDTLFAIHPFVSDGEYALVLPSFWRNEELMVKYAQKVVPLEHIKDDAIKVTNSQSGGGALYLKFENLTLIQSLSILRLEQWRTLIIVQTKRLVKAG